MQVNVLVWPTTAGKRDKPLHELDEGRADYKALEQKGRGVDVSQEQLGWYMIDSIKFLLVLIYDSLMSLQVEITGDPEYCTIWTNGDTSRSAVASHIREQAVPFLFPTEICHFHHEFSSAKY